MFIYVLSPSNIRDFFANFVDKQLSAGEDWNLTLHQSSELLSSPAGCNYAEVTNFVILSNALSDVNSRIRVGVSHESISKAHDYYAYDLWGFSLNPLRLVDDVLTYIDWMCKAGCLCAVSYLPLQIGDGGPRTSDYFDGTETAKAISAPRSSHSAKAAGSDKRANWEMIPYNWEKIPGPRLRTPRIRKSPSGRR